MRAIFADVGWVVNKIESDYGVDFDVQMFEENRASGEWFKIQLKSSDNTDYSAHGDFVSETISTNHAAHYSTEMRDPIFLIHADVKARRTFWFAPQLALPVAADDPRATVTYRIEEGDLKADPLKQIVENRASGLGINMSDPEDATVKLIRLGIRDANTERAIKHCEHAFVSISGKVAGWENMLAELLQLPSIRAKIIHCDLLGYAVEGRTLDDAFQNFRSEYCDKCMDISPRPSDWKYSDDWQQTENESHREFMTNFRRQRYDPD